MDFLKDSDITDKNILYKFFMKIQDPEILKLFGSFINLLFKNRENRKKRGKITLTLYVNEKILRTSSS